MARRYVTAEIDALREQACLSLGERRCPVCGHLGIRRYYTLFGEPQSASLITYLWCPQCHSYEGSTGPGAGLALDRDPMGELAASAVRALRADIDSYLTKLDEFWQRGDLPQQLGKGPRT